MDKNRVFIVTDDKGNEIEMYILFTTKLDQYNKNYIFYYNPKDLEAGVFVSSYNENNQLFPVEDEKEWELLNEVFEDFQEEAANTKCEGCSSNCEEGCTGNQDCSNCDKQDK